MTVTTTPEGYLKVQAKFARSGVYDYLAAELRSWGVTLDSAIPDDAIVKVMRKPEEVFDPESLSSFENKPITVNHPPHAVSPATLKDDLVGMSLAPVRKDSDGIHTRGELILMAQDGISEFRSGTRQLSAGYKAELVLKGGMTSDGMPFDAEQRSIRGNHIALVKQGRAGTARMMDKKGEDMSDKKDDKTQVQALADALAENQALKKENETLKGQVAALEKSVLTDEQLAERISQAVDQAREEEKARDEVVTKALKFAPKLEVADTMTVRDIMTKAIEARSPDMDLTDKSDDYVAGVFGSLKASTNGQKKETNTQDSAHGGQPQFLGFDKAKSLTW
jgi:hypothetical protein